MPGAHSPGRPSIGGSAPTTNPSSRACRGENSPSYATAAAGHEGLAGRSPRRSPVDARDLTRREWDPLRDGRPTRRRASTTPRGIEEARRTPQALRADPGDAGAGESERWQEYPGAGER